MAEPTFFGTGFSQTATTFTITKADLPGLTATSTNTQESLLVALLLKAKASLTQAAADTNPDQGVVVEDGFASIVTRGETEYQRRSLTVNLDKVNASIEIDPDDY